MLARILVSVFSSSRLSVNVGRNSILCSSRHSPPTTPHHFGITLYK